VSFVAREPVAAAASRPHPLDLLIVGAGPYGLATARTAARAGLQVEIVGEPMGFWRASMPRGMLLRSGRQWHLDAVGELTFDTYLESRRIDGERVEPIPVERYLDYADWFRERAGITVRRERVARLDRVDDRFVAAMEGGATIQARQVVAAAGVGPFVHIPAELAAKLPAGRFHHTCHLVDFAPLAGRRVGIIGGRQSAFEWAALIAEAGAVEVHVIFRHETPRFEPSDWSWVDPLLDAVLAEPGWFRRLPSAERESIRQRFWAEGRLKLEPWLAPRLAPEVVRIRPREEVVSCVDSSGALALTLASGASVAVDTVILATGYRVDVSRIPYLSRSLVAAVMSGDGYPQLDDHFQTPVPGLYMPGLASTRDFGPFFGFVRGAPVAAAIMTRQIASAAASSWSHESQAARSREVRDDWRR
jgi:cation diffusion facilitator CzcD-associated flavoprotein CzcO